MMNWSLIHWERKTALFVIMSDTDATFNFIVSIMYSQLFNLLCDKADDVYNGRWPIHVRCLLDEFANIGQIPQFEKLIATIRSREISASIILQSKSQLKAVQTLTRLKETATLPCFWEERERYSERLGRNPWKRNN